MKAKKLVLPIALIMTLLLAPLVKAQFDIYFISDILKGEFFHFVLVFLFFFGVCYFALKKIIFGEEQAIAFVVAVVISFFITNSSFEYFEEFLASKTVLYVALFGALLAAMVTIKFLLKIGSLNLAWISGAYIIFFWILNTKLISFKYRSMLLSGNFGRLLWVIAIFAAFIIIFAFFKRLSKRRAVTEGGKT